MNPQDIGGCAFDDLPRCHHAKVPHITFSVPPRTWAQFRSTLLAARPGAGEELLGFFFCTRHRVGQRRWRLLPRAWVVPCADCYEHQSTGGLALRQDCHAALLHDYLKPGVDVVHIHTHPGTHVPRFSGVDDHHESVYSRFLANLPERPRLVSGVFDEDMQQGQFRAWPRDGQDHPEPVAFNTDWFRGHQQTSPNQFASDARFDRQRIFGSGIQKILADIRVGLIGCGGIGAVFAEQLARLGVRRWLLVDPDHMDVTNLNRLPCATSSMVTEGWSKVRYVKRLIKTAWRSGSEVVGLQCSVTDRAAKRDLSRCDLIVVATDNHLSRFAAQQIALRYVRPLVSLGSHVEVDEKGRRALCRVTVPPLDGGWCLMCQGIIDPMVAALEAAPPELAAPARRAGYLSGVAAPAVFWLNSICASLGVYAIHGALSSMVDVEKGIDWVIDAGAQAWLPVPHEESANCLHCSHDGEWAAGPRHREFCQR